MLCIYDPYWFRIDMQNVHHVYFPGLQLDATELDVYNTWLVKAGIWLSQQRGMELSLALLVNIERIKLLTWRRKERGSCSLSWGRYICLHKYFRVDLCAGWTQLHADTAIHRSSHTAETVTKMRPPLERWKADFYCRCKVYTGHELNRRALCVDRKTYAATYLNQKYMFWSFWGKTGQL